MLLLLKIVAVIVLIICLGFIAYWAVAVIKGDCVLRMLKSKRTPLHVESMDMRHVKLSFTIPIKNVGKQLGTIMDAFVRIYIPLEQYDKAKVTGHLTDFDVPRPDDYWQAFLDLAGGAAESLARLPDATQARLRAEVAADLADHRDGDGYVVESTVLVASARR